jgi:hypothetical protein
MPPGLVRSTTSRIDPVLSRTSESSYLVSEGPRHTTCDRALTSMLWMPMTRSKVVGTVPATPTLIVVASRATSTGL